MLACPAGSGATQQDCAQGQSRTSSGRPSRRVDLFEDGGCLDLMSVTDGSSSEGATVSRSRWQGISSDPIIPSMLGTIMLPEHEQLEKLRDGGVHVFAEDQTS